MVSNNPVRFSGHSSPVSGDIMVFVSRVDISRPHDQSVERRYGSVRYGSKGHGLKTHRILY